MLGHSQADGFFDVENRNGNFSSSSDTLDSPFHFIMHVTFNLAGLLRALSLCFVVCVGSSAF